MQVNVFRPVQFLSLIGTLVISSLRHIIYFVTFIFIYLYLRHISSVITSCLSNIRDLGRIRPILDQTTAVTARNIATALVHSELDYCTSLFLNLPANQLDRHQLVRNSAVRAVTRIPQISSHNSYSQISPLTQNFSTYT